LVSDGDKSTHLARDFEEAIGEHGADSSCGGPGFDLAQSAHGRGD
jgi:hypothetical protein